MTVEQQRRAAPCGINQVRPIEAARRPRPEPRSRDRSTRRRPCRRGLAAPARSRSASSRARSSAYCASSTGSREQLQHRPTALEGARPRSHRRSSAAARPDLLGRPDVEPALLALAVGIQRRREATLDRCSRSASIHSQVSIAIRRASGDPGQPPPVGVHPGQQSVVVQHLLEVRHDPARRPRSSGQSRRRAGRTCRRAPSARR